MSCKILLMLLGKYLIPCPFLDQLSVNMKNIFKSMKNIFKSRCILRLPRCLFHDTSTVTDLEIKSKCTF